jgi:Protein of unknown function (DUF3301)
METALLVGLGVLAIWFWLDSARAREIATERARTECRRRGLLFLDDTVALRKLRPRATPQGLRFRRQFDFDFNDGTEARYRGGVTVLGAQIADFDLGGWRDLRVSPPGPAAVEVAVPSLPPPMPSPESSPPEYGGNVIPLRRRQ